MPPPPSSCWRRPPWPASSGRRWPTCTASARRRARSPATRRRARACCSSWDGCWRSASATRTAPSRPIATARAWTPAAARPGRACAASTRRATAGRRCSRWPSSRRARSAMPVERSRLFQEMGQIWRDQLGDAEQAEQYFQRARQERDSAATAPAPEPEAERHAALVQEAWICAARGDSTRAVAALREALESDPGNVEAIDMLVTVLDGAERHAELAELLERRAALAADPTTRAAVLSRLGSGARAAARRHVGRALRLRARPRFRSAQPGRPGRAAAHLPAHRVVERAAAAARDGGDGRPARAARRDAVSARAAARAPVRRRRCGGRELPGGAGPRARQPGRQGGADAAPGRQRRGRLRRSGVRGARREPRRAGRRRARAQARAARVRGRRRRTRRRPSCGCAWRSCAAPRWTIRSAPSRCWSRVSSRRTRWCWWHSGWRCSTSAAAVTRR